MQTLCFSRAGIARGGLPSVARRPENSLIVRKRCECPLRELSYIIATRERGRRRPDKGWAERATLHIAFSSGSDSSPLEGSGDVKRDNSSPRRTAKIAFTCDRCGGRTVRDVNPHALAKGTIFVQCAHCDKFHQLVDNLELIEEYNFKEEEE